MRAVALKAGDRIQRWLQRFGLHVSRGAPNRFAAIPAALAHLHRRGFRPTVVIDGGANVGRWTSTAHALFSDAAFHMVEPQPTCVALLEDLRRRLPRTTLSAVALAAPGVERVRMIGVAPGGLSEGAFVTDDPDAEATTLPASTLDALFADRITAADRVFLKLDLEGQELNALRGAERLLPSVDVVLCEVHFFDPYRSGCAVFGQVADFLAARGFEVYDIAALMPRARDGRLNVGDVVFARSDSALCQDVSWQ